jgi:hypothetical protein
MKKAYISSDSSEKAVRLSKINFDTFTAMADISVHNKLFASPPQWTESYADFNVTAHSFR